MVSEGLGGGGGACSLQASRHRGTGPRRGAWRARARGTQGQEGGRLVSGSRSPPLTWQPDKRGDTGCGRQHLAATQPTRAASGGRGPGSV